MEFTGIRTLKDSQRKNLLLYFKNLQKLDPIVKEFSNKAFRSYVCFTYVECENPFRNCWIIEVLAVEELFYFPYPFLISKNKNDLRLKVQFIESLAVNEQEKFLDLEELFNRINVRNNQLIRIKKSMSELLKELVENKIIQNELEIIFKSGKKIHGLIKNLSIADITRRIKILKLTEILIKLYFTI